MTFLTDKAWSAGLEDCATTFAGDSVPTVEDLRETAEREVARFLATTAVAFYACVDAYIAGYRCKARTLVDGWRKCLSDDD